MPEQEDVRTDASADDAPNVRRRTRRRIGKGIETGDVLVRTFAIWARNLLSYSMVAIAFAIPSYLLSFYAAKALNQEDGVSWITVFFTLMLGTAIGFLTNGFITYSVFQQLRGTPVPIAEGLRVTMSRLVPIIAVSLLGSFLIALGSLLFLIPGIMLFCMFYVMVPVAVVETPGVVESLKRSRRLTDGHKWSIFALIFIMGALLGIATAIVTRSLGHFLELGETATTVVEALVNAVTSSIAAVAGTVVYHDLRTGKEGIDIDQLVAVFE